MTLNTTVSQKVMQRVTTGGSAEPEEMEAIGMTTLLSGYVGEVSVYAWRCHVLHGDVMYWMVMSCAVW